VFDYGVVDGQVWLVMERLLGRELLEALTEEHTLPVDQAVRITIAVLQGLHAAHQSGLVHRDVKPSNVFLCRDPNPQHAKLLDFGIAITLEDELEEDPNVILGTPRYMAPEQVSRDELDGRADVYAVGLVLYEMLSGDIPFKAPDVRSLAFQRLAVTPKPLSELVPGLPEGLSDIVMRALEVSPDDRWPDARSMAEALREILDEPVQA
jgi:serine/threonine-protein kinase